MDENAVVIRPLKSMEEFRFCHTVQAKTWGLKDMEEVIPDHQLLTAHKNGGLVLGAFHKEEMVGFSYGFIGLNQQNKIIFCSHILAVLPEYRGMGIGYKMKLAQREGVLAKGIDIINWTFDPLETANAKLNFTKLGGVSNTYYLNHYGKMLDELNKGLPSDRLLVEWHINTKRVKDIIGGKAIGTPTEAFKALELILSASGPEPLIREFKEEKTVFIDIPVGFQKLKKENKDLALKWRLSLRDALCHYFKKGYYISCLHNITDKKATYVLIKGEKLS